MAMIIGRRRKSNRVSYDRSSCCIFVTGSYHPFDQGLQRSTLHTHFPNPTMTHFFSSDSIIYSLQLGICLQYGGLLSAFAHIEWSGERYCWYLRIRSMRIFFIIFWIEFTSLFFRFRIRENLDYLGWHRYHMVFVYIFLDFLLILGFA